MRKLMFSTLLSILLVACGGDDSSENNSDTNSPIFTSPSTVSVNENQKAGLTLIATDENRVTYSISGGDSNSFKVDASTGVVMFKAEPDYETKNSYIFTAKANDGVNETSQDVIINIINLPIEFASEITLSSDFAYTNESKEMVARIAVITDTDSEVEINTVELYNENNSTIILKDDGVVSNGDDILDDGIFSGKLTLLENSEKNIEFRVKVNDEYISDTSIVNIISKFTDEEILEAQEISTNALNLLPKNINLTSSELSSNLDNVINSLKTDEDVLKVSVSDDKTIIQYTTKTGYEGGIIFSTKNNNGGDTTENIRNTKTQKYKKYNHPLFKTNSAYFQNLTTKKYAYNSRLKSTVNTISSIGNSKALILAPFEYDGISGLGIKEKLESNSHFSVDYIRDYEVTVDKFKNLNKYGIIAFRTHSNKTGVILTGQQATEDLIKQYSADIKNKRLVTIKHEVLVEDGGFWFWEDDDTEENVEVFLLNSSFIAYHNKNLPDSLVYLGMCSGLESDNPLPKVLTSIGAKTVVGFNNTVFTSYSNPIASTLFEEMVNRKTVKESLDEAKEQHGVNDGSTDDPPTPAEPVFIGDANLKLFKEGIENGSFEENLKFWVQQGDVRVISKLAELEPQNGKLMNIISTGLGSNSDANSYVQQSFIVPNNSSKLIFSYNVISEEPTEFLDSEYDDRFEVHIIDEDNNDSIVISETVNTSTWHYIQGIDFYGGDDTVYQTKWKQADVDVSKYQGKSITLKFLVYDKGDSDYDTAALLDNVELQ